MKRGKYEERGSALVRGCHNPRADLGEAGVKGILGEAAYFRWRG